MPRIAADLSQRRETKAWEMFSRSEIPPIEDVQKEVEKLGGGKMNLARIYQLRKAAIDGTGFPPRQSKKKESTT